MKNLKTLLLSLFICLTVSPVIFPSDIVSLEVYPRPLELSVGDTILFKVVARNSEGRVFSVLFPQWSVDQKDLGRFSSLNEPVTTFTAEKAGKGKIIVSYGEVKGEQEIIIYDTLPPYNDIWPKRMEQ